MFNNKVQKLYCDDVYNHQKTKALKIKHDDNETEFDYDIVSLILLYTPSSKTKFEKFIHSLNPNSSVKGEFYVTFNFQKHSGDAFSYICHDSINNVYHHTALSNSGAFTTKIKIKLDINKKKELYDEFVKYYRKLNTKHKKK